MNGGKDEIKKVREILEKAMKQHFKKLSIPAAWLVLSLCLRKREEKTSSLVSVLQLAGELGMSEEEAKLALWFLHHHAGVLMYFPMLAELKDTVICDTQVMYDSATNLIIDTFRFGSGVGRAASKKFRETGQFSLNHICKATACFCFWRLHSTPETCEAARAPQYHCSHCSLQHFRSFLLHALCPSECYT